MRTRPQLTLLDRFALALAGGVMGGLFGFVLALLVSGFLHLRALEIDVIWYTAGYVALAFFILGPIAADLVAMLMAGLFGLFMAISTNPYPGMDQPKRFYERNPFDKPWHWSAVGLFVIGLVVVVFHAF